MGNKAHHFSEVLDWCRCLQTYLVFPSSGIPVLPCFRYDRPCTRLYSAPFDLKGSLCLLQFPYPITHRSRLYLSANAIQECKSRFRRPNSVGLDYRLRPSCRTALLACEREVQQFFLDRFLRDERSGGCDSCFELPITFAKPKTGKTLVHARLVHMNKPSSDAFGKLSRKYYLHLKI